MEDPYRFPRRFSIKSGSEILSMSSRAVAGVPTIADSPSLGRCRSRVGTGPGP